MYRDNPIFSGLMNGVMAGALWGLVFLAPQLLPHHSSVQLSVARYLVYGLFALVLLLPRWQVLKKLTARDWVALLWLSLAGNIIYYVFLSQAVVMIGGAATSLIIGLLPVVITLIGAKESQTVKLRHLFPPLLLCCLGVALIGYQSLSAVGTEANVAHTGIGFFCAFAALVSWAAYAVGNSRHLLRIPHISSHDWSLMTGLVTGTLACLMGIFVFSGDTTVHTSADWLRFWGVSSGIAIFASIVGNRFWNQASRLLPLTLTGQMVIFEILFALLYSFLWEHRFPSPLEFLAIFCLMGGVIWCTSVHNRVHLDKSPVV